MIWNLVFDAIETKPMYYIYEKSKKNFAVIRDRVTKQIFKTLNPTVNWVSDKKKSLKDHPCDMIV